MTKRSKLFSYAEGSKFKNRTHEEIFGEIRSSNWWEGTQSKSGSGSTLDQTKEIVEQLPGILKEFNIKIMLDAPCGDYNWMKHLDKNDIEYVGADIVSEFINENSKWEDDNIKFIQLNLMKDPLGDFDLLFCRDCLVHFSFNDICNVLLNVFSSNIKYLMTTTFTDEKNNDDIDTGGWRPINFLKDPFYFPEPLILLNEKCSEADGAFPDKSLGLWKVDDLRKLNHIKSLIP